MPDATPIAFLAVQPSHGLLIAPLERLGFDSDGGLSRPANQSPSFGPYVLPYLINPDFGV